MSWTSPADLRVQIQRLWDKGVLLASLTEVEEPHFPLRLMLKGPTSSELSERFDAVRVWIASLQHDARTTAKPGYRIVMRELRHRVIGANALPHEIWIDSPEDAFALIGKRRDAERFKLLLAQTATCQPSLIHWIRRRPLQALELADKWPLLLEIINWLRANPRPGIYLRQVDIPGVHTKFIEANRAMLAELLDLALPSNAINQSASGSSNFARRYGFLDKPVRIRFRMLDSRHAVSVAGIDQDLAISCGSFARLDPGVSRVFITENEINFLALPAVDDCLAIFGSGYGFEMLAQAEWLRHKTIFYWGDIDTHGFAILDQLRALFPHVRSFLMDRATLLTHRQQWGDEPTPASRELLRLNEDEWSLYNDLRDNRFGQRIRLEQEKVSFSWVAESLLKLQTE